MKILHLKLAHFLRLNLISLKLYSFYKLNKYGLILLLLGTISSILIRSNMFNETIFHINHFMIHIFIFFVIFYSIYLILNVLHRGIQSVRIIPQYVQWSQENIKNINSILFLYYIQNIFFILLSSWILYNILMKLNLWMESIDIMILFTGIISSIIFHWYYPLNTFHLDTKMKSYPLYIYMFLLGFFIFYIFIVPFIVLNILHSEQFIQLKENFIQKCIQNSYNYMDPSKSNPTQIKIDEIQSSAIRVSDSNTNVNIDIGKLTHSIIEVIPQPQNTSLSSIPQMASTSSTSQNALTLQNTSSITPSLNTTNIPIEEEEENIVLATMNNSETGKNILDKVNKKGFFDNLFHLKNKIRSNPPQITEEQFNYYFNLLFNKAIEQDPVNRKLLYQNSHRLTLNQIINLREFYVLYLNNTYEAFTMNPQNKIIILSLNASSSKYFLYLYTNLDHTSYWRNHLIYSIHPRTFDQTLTHFYKHRPQDFLVETFPNGWQQFELLEKEGTLKNLIQKVSLKKYILYFWKDISMYSFKTKYDQYYFNCNSLFKIPYLIEEYTHGSPHFRMAAIDKKYLTLALKHKLINLYTLEKEH